MTAASHAQHVDRPHDRRLHRLDGIELIVARRCRAGQIVNLIHLQPDRLNHIVPHQIKIRPVEQMRDVGLLACEKIVQADHIVFKLDQTLAQVRTQKAGAARD
jgi:hypothetical protein